MSHQLYTQWGKEQDSQHVLEEYPRPQFVRESYKNLNGVWDYAITCEENFPAQYQGQIVVPFSPECTLSGVNRQLQPEEYLHYRRSVDVDEDWMQGEVLLHFGAVDQICEIYVNGHPVGKHTGGYLPFSFYIQEFLQVGENILQLTVQDMSDTSYHSKGKQSLEPGRMWYTAQSGIWQTVWMEQVPLLHAENIKIDPDYDGKSVTVKVFSHERRRGKGSLEVLFAGQRVAITNFETNMACKIELPEVISWSPEEPNLYDLVITLGEDRIRSYFAMRKFSVARDARGIRRFFLNNQPYFLHGVLDQGYWPESLYTPPSDEAMTFDIQSMKSLGYNLLRKHIKVEPARWYMHCDRIGMVVWQDMVNGGTRYPYNFVTVMPNIMNITCRHIKDDKYRILSRNDVAGREEYYTELHDMIKALYNVPCIAAWVPFNEGWGQFDAKEATLMVRKLDAGRLIDEASGWFDQGGGDVYSIHNYWFKLKNKPKNRMVALTEYGGYAMPVPEHIYGEVTFGYRIYRNKETLTERYVRLMREEIIPNIARGLSTTVYTQLSDVEAEVNGLLTYDRELVKMDIDTVKEINAAVFDAFRCCVETQEDKDCE
ncbi:MAG: glycoside hydrolase family 2 TIM barrel-domain containing protein [Lachnospiraceae bacterium]|nr:glycoside hydrolase family 2 TIM barrel-domain containing protein [Lachnospiraceae bacterium]